VNDLVDHHFTKIKLFVVSTVPNILRDHGNAVFIVSKTLASATVKKLALIVIIIQCADSRVLSNAAVTLSPSFVVLPSQVEWLQEKQNGDAYQSHKEK